MQKHARTIHSVLQILYFRLVPIQAARLGPQFQDLLSLASLAGMARHATAVTRVHGVPSMAVTVVWFAAGPARPASQLWANSVLPLGFQATPTVPKGPTTPTSNASPIHTCRKRDGVASRRGAGSHPLIPAAFVVMVTSHGSAPRCTAATQRKSERRLSDSGHVCVGKGVGVSSFKRTN